MENRLVARLRQVYGDELVLGTLPDQTFASANPIVFHLTVTDFEALAVLGAAGFRAIEIDDVETADPVRCETARDLTGIFAVDGLLVVVALGEADAVAVDEIDGGDDFEGGHGGGLGWLVDFGDE